MLKEFVKEIAGMAQARTFTIGEEYFSDKPLIRIDPKKNFPKCITLTGLDSICKMVRKEACGFFAEEQKILIQVKSHDTVNVFTTMDYEMDRNYLYSCQADTPSIIVNRFMSQEQAAIQLRSLYIPTEDTKYLLDLISSISQESKVTSMDNGVTQTVEAKSGISLHSKVNVKPNVTLNPFRTFLEVEQPDSLYLIRFDKDGDIGLFEADGGVWKLEATRNIAKYFEDNLKDLIEKGQVVILR